MKEYLIWLAKVITTLVVIFIVIPIGLIGVLSAVMQTAENTWTKETVGSKNLVAVISLDGMIIDSKEIVKQLYRAAKDNTVKGIVLRVNSPGGGVSASQDIYTAINYVKRKKPVVASMASVAASGGLYSALSASKIFAQPGTLTGSIGVIMQIPNFYKITNQLGFDMITVKSGALKDVGNVFREMNTEERNFLEDTIKVVHEQFVQAVSESRNIPKADVEKFADGRVILGSQAKALGLIDEVGDLLAASRAVFELLDDPLGEEEEPTLLYQDSNYQRLREIFESVSNFFSIFSNSAKIQYLMQ